MKYIYGKQEKKTHVKLKTLHDIHVCVMLVIFPSIYDGKIQWSTSDIENVADFCHFVTSLY